MRSSCEAGCFKPSSPLIYPVALQISFALRCKTFVKRLSPVKGPLPNKRTPPQSKEFSFLLVLRKLTNVTSSAALLSHSCTQALKSAKLRSMADCVLETPGPVEVGHLEEAEQVTSIFFIPCSSGSSCQFSLDALNVMT